MKRVPIHICEELNAKSYLIFFIQFIQIWLMLFYLPYQKVPIYTYIVFILSFLILSQCSILLTVKKRKDDRLNRSISFLILVATYISGVFLVYPSHSLAIDYLTLVIILLITKRAILFFIKGEYSFSHTGWYGMLIVMVLILFILQGMNLRAFQIAYDTIMIIGLVLPLIILPWGWKRASFGRRYDRNIYLLYCVLCVVTLIIGRERLQEVEALIYFGLHSLILSGVLFKVYGKIFLALILQILRETLSIMVLPLLLFMGIMLVQKDILHNAYFIAAFFLFYLEIKAIDFVLMMKSSNRFDQKLLILMQLEQLKSKAADLKVVTQFLHDEILPKLQIIKSKVYEKDSETVVLIDQLELQLREEMNFLAPYISKTLPLKKNYEIMIDQTQKLYEDKKILCDFYCNDHFHLPFPYDEMVYRMLKELLNNTYKHTESCFVEIHLRMKKDMLSIFYQDDEGMIDLERLEHPGALHGLSDIMQTVKDLGGEIEIKNIEHHEGTIIQIQIPILKECVYENIIH